MRMHSIICACRQPIYSAACGAIKAKDNSRVLQLIFKLNSSYKVSYSCNEACRSFQALNWKENHLYLVINVWSLRYDLERLWFRTRWARLACQTFICVLRLQTDITTLLNTSIVKVPKPIVASIAYLNTHGLYCTFDCKPLSS